jgi:Leucine-rich repeat (LRR) protein
MNINNKSNLEEKLISSNQESMMKKLSKLFTFEKKREKIILSNNKSEEIKGAGKKYIFYEKMDDSNKNIMDISASKGINEAIKAMFTDEKTGTNISYAEMRSRYG